MSIEDRVRRVLDHAVANEPPPRRAPLERALRRRRHPALVGAAAVLGVLALVVAVAVMRRPGHPPASPTTTTTAPLSTAGWPAYLERDDNLRLRYPPGWKVRRGPGGAELVPPEYASSRPGRAKYAVTVAAFPGFYLSGYDWRTATSGRLPGGQAYMHMVGYPDLPPGEDPPAPPAVAPGRRYAVYMVDLGRFCSTEPRPFCGPHALRIAVYDANARAFDRYRQHLDAIVRSVSQPSPAPASTDDAGRPACRPDQWRLESRQGWSSGGDLQRVTATGTLRYRGGPACFLRVVVRGTVERDGRPLAVDGSPVTTTVQGLLPDDDQRRLNRLGVHDTPLTWWLTVDGWCNPELAGAALWVRAAGGGELELPLPDAGGQPATEPASCQPGRTASLTGLP